MSIVILCIVAAAAGYLCYRIGMSAHRFRRSRLFYPATRVLTSPVLCVVVTMVLGIILTGPGLVYLVMIGGIAMGVASVVPPLVRARLGYYAEARRLGRPL